MGMKKSLLIWLPAAAVLALAVTGLFLYEARSDAALEAERAARLEAQVEELNETVSGLEAQIGELSRAAEKSGLFIAGRIDIYSDGSLYDFAAGEWVTQIGGAGAMYFIALDGEKNLYITDRFENVHKKLDARLEKLKIYDTDVDNYVIRAYVSKEQNALIIPTAEDFITFEVDLDDFSVALAEFNDD